MDKQQIPESTRQNLTPQEHPTFHALLQFSKWLEAQKTADADMSQDAVESFYEISNRIVETAPELRRSLSILVSTMLLDDVEQAKKQWPEIEFELGEWFQERHASTACTPSRSSGSPDRVKLTDGGITIDDKAVALTGKQRGLLEVLIEAKGDYVSMAAEGYRTRDIEGLPLAAQQVIESDPGAGTRISREWFS